MIVLGWYLLKVIICSAILCGYYYAALRNKRFHRWNRFFLLASVVLSLLLPLIKINIFQNAGDDKGAVIQVLQTISYGDEAVIEYSRKGFHINSEILVAGTYVAVSLVFTGLLLMALYRIKKLKKKFPETDIEGVRFIETNASGTPFSFFNSIFWNSAIDLYSNAGKHIFNHEIAHVKEKHSYDKLFMNLVLIFFWINPFFWIMRKELYMIHEFIADQKALDDNDITAFSEMILQTVYPGQNFSLTNNFFYSPLKRRLIMLTKNKNPKVSYVSRLLVLPLAAIVFFAFTLKVKKASDGIVYKNKMINVVIDAGHGGSDNGAVSPDGLKEKDIVLSIAEKIKALNTNPNVHILLSRNHDELIPLKDRVEFAKENGADMFISIHLDAAEKEEPSNGFSVIIDRSNNNQLLASALIGELKKSYKTEDNIKGRNGNIFVLDKNPLPAALIECGYITDAGDKAFITNNSNQEKIAKNILDAINIYASADKTSSVAPVAIASGPGNDTIREMYYKGKKVTGLSLSSSRNTVKVKYADGSKETITKEEAEKRGFRLPPPPPAPVPPVAPNAAVPPVPPVPAAPAAAPAPPVPPLPKDAVYVVDGKEVSVALARSIDRDKIQSINVLKDGAAVKKYGEKGRNGVIEIQLKDNNDGIQITAVHNQIPGESLYIVDGKERPSSEVKSIPPAHIESINVLKGESAVKKYGDKGKNGVIEITLKSDAASQFLPGTDKVFTQTETPATFPGGPAAWSKFIMGKIQANIDSLSDKDYGTCVLKFLVKKDGKISDVKATTMQGTRLAEVAVNAVKNGPDWNPAEQNGHKVNSFRLQPVTLKKSN